MMLHRPSGPLRWVAGSAIAASAFVTSLAHALSPDEAIGRAQAAITEVEQAAPKVKSEALSRLSYQPEAMVAASDLHLRLGQKREAIDKLNLVVELGRTGRAKAATLAEAEYLLGQAYFENGELYSARRQFELVSDRASQSEYAALAPRAVSRLVDIALQLDQADVLPEVLARIERLQQLASSDAVQYAKAKVLLALNRLEDARDLASGITAKTTYAQRAHYVKGVALMKAARALESDPKKADFGPAIAAFEQATVIAQDTEAEQARKIADLAWLAIARLHFENGRFMRAAQAYEKIPRNSEQFGRALFEISWAFVKMGDYVRGQRTLEALRVLLPGLVDGADAALLRADLMLRSGRFAEADKAYAEVRATYDPLREQVDRYLETNTDPAIYYDRLTAAEIEGTDLPPLVVDWAREEARENRVFSIVDDVARSRGMIRDAQKRIALLRATISGDTRTKVFPEIRRELEKVVGLLNQLGVARLSLARGLDEEAGTASGELSQVRAERRRIMARLGVIPTSPGDFTVRDAEAEKQWNKMSQALQRLELEAGHLQALVNGLRLVLSQAEKHGIVIDAATKERYRVEIEENEKDMALYKDRILELREQVDMGRVQSGFGDERFHEDERVRRKFREVFSRELALVQAGGSSDEKPYAKRAETLVLKMEKLELALDEAERLLEAEAMERSKELESLIAAEALAIAAYAERLDTMDQHARVLVGEVARDNFIKVRARLKDVVLRSDVGAVQKSWEVRENQRMRVRDLLRERAQEERYINDELREVLDDAEEMP